MEKKDVIELVGKKIKLLDKRDWYYRGIVLAVGDDYIKIRDFNDKTWFLVLSELKTIRVLE